MYQIDTRLTIRGPFFFFFGVYNHYHPCCCHHCCYHHKKQTKHKIYLWWTYYLNLCLQNPIRFELPERQYYLHFLDQNVSVHLRLGFLSLAMLRGERMLGIASSKLLHSPVGLCDTQGWVSSSSWRTQDSAWILECSRSSEVSVMHRRLNLRNSLLGPLSNVGDIRRFKSLESERELENLEAFLVFIILPEEFSRTLKWTVPSSSPVLSPDPSVHPWPQTQPLMQPDWCVSHVHSPSHGALWALAFPSRWISSFHAWTPEAPKGFCLN